MMVALLALLAVALAPPAEAAISAKSIGERFACTAGESLTAGTVVAIKDADGYCYKADADDSTIRPAMGWVVQGYSSGATVQVVSKGILTGFTSLTKGAPVYLSGTAGSYTQTAPSYPQVIGYALTATDVRIDIQRPLDSSVASTSLKKKLLVYAVENLAANADIGDGTAANARTMFLAPSALTLTSIKLYSRGTQSGIDDSNTFAIKIYNATATVVSGTYGSTPSYPANYTLTSLGTLSNTTVASGAAVKLEVINGTNADPAAFDLYLEYVTTD